MKLNKREQYGILIGLYIQRAGRGNLKDLAANLGLSLPFLEQVARLLRIGGVLQAIKGPGGGYSLIGDPSVGKILKALGTELVLDSADALTYKVSGVVEHRALGLFSEYLVTSINKVLKLPLSVIGQGLVEREVALLDKMAETSLVS